MKTIDLHNSQWSMTKRDPSLDLCTKFGCYTCEDTQVIDQTSTGMPCRPQGHTPTMGDHTIHSKVAVRLNKQSFLHKYKEYWSFS